MTVSTDRLEPIWHDVECGAYAADLTAWVEIAATAPGPVLELGAGTGRVALQLAAAGVDVVALDSSPALLGELSDRARARGLRIAAVEGDARELDAIDAVGRGFGAIVAPMQLAQILGGPGGRAALLRGARARLLDGGVVACALLAEDAETIASGPDPALLPDVRELDGWIYSSQPLSVATEDGEIVIRRLRQVVSPAGELAEERNTIRLECVSPDRFEHEAAAAGLRGRERIAVAATADHVGSTICVMEAA